MLEKRIVSLITAVALVSPSVGHAAPLPFPDMEGSWYRYREAAQYLKDKGVIGGYEDGTFRPKATINRAELLKIVFKGKSGTQPSGRRCFSDVNPDAWFAPFVCAAKNRGIVKGYPNGLFKPEEPVNFAEAIKIVLNAYGREVPEAKGKEWYEPYVEELDRTDVLPRRSYLPWAPLTRERAADLLWRVLRYDEERVVPRLSPGCGKATVEAPRSVTVHGEERSFLLTIPQGYVPHDPVPLIVAFHGRTNSNEQVRQYYRLDRAAGDAIIAYPAALKNGKNFAWSANGDVAFFDALVELLAERYCIDMDRISTVGHSLGAWMANTVACLRGGVVMASATVGGDSVIAECSGPAAALIAHNPKDNLAPFSGAERVRELRAGANMCPWETEPGPGSLNCVEHVGCPGGNAILWCPHTQDTDHDGEYYPHTWPQGMGQIVVDFLKGIP